MIRTIGTVSKAVAAATAAFAGAFGTAAADGTVTTAEWVGVAIAVVLAGVGTYAAPKNREPGTPPAPPSPGIDPAD